MAEDWFGRHRVAFVLNFWEVLQGLTGLATGDHFLDCLTIQDLNSGIPFWTTSSSRPPTKDSQRARTALQALQTVLVPSCSPWPTRYINLVKHASNHRTGSRIVFPLSMLLQDVCDGVIELRDPLYTGC